MKVENEFDIAIVGMSGRFPGAGNLGQFWCNLASGVESIYRFSDEELLSSGVPASYINDPQYVKAAPILEDPGAFDAGFFSFTPAEAKTMDPQQRILLELAYEALENAGYDTERYSGRVGVFTGSAFNTYFLHREDGSGQLAEDYIPTLIGTDKDFLSTRISYKLNLKGPSLTIQTACSTSMVAVHLARQSLLSNEVDMVLAGGISIRVPHRAGYFYDGGGVVSRDGHVRAFDAQANGTVFGSGGGILVLRRLADAISDGDTIYAVIKGSAVNNDGSEKAGYTAPSVNGQAEAVIEALANAGVAADTIGYVEAHGSGTPIGDPVEVSALTKAYRTFTQRSGYCAIGSVKTNVGHLDAAAAVTGIIKTVLALRHRQLPPSLNFREPNPEIDFPNTPFYVNNRLREWPSRGLPRRAGVMSTGMGGTNAHLILEEAPEPGKRSFFSSPQVLVLSAKTETALDQATHRLAEFLEGDDAVNMADVAYTLQVGRRAFSHRRYAVCSSRESALHALQEGSKQVSSAQFEGSVSRPLVLLLPGVGDQYVGMAHGLYQTWDIFRQEIDRCAKIVEPYLEVDIRKILYPENQSWKKGGKRPGIDLERMMGRSSPASQDSETRTLNRTLFAQPALFAVEYALARLWESLGIVPDALIGHSMGEYVAACLAGVLSLEDALRLIAVRAKLVEELPQGAMLAVLLPEAELLPWLSEDLSIALVNGPSLCVVAGPVAAVAELGRSLENKNIVCRPVQNGHAFHSKMLAPIVKRFEQEVRKVRLHEPQIAYISNVTGKWITPAEATNPAYWAMHVERTAQFNHALQELWQFHDPILLEAGPGRTLSILAMQHPGRLKAGDPVAVCSLRHDYENQPDAEFLCRSMGKLWLSGAPIQWENATHPGPRYRISLPTYPFDKQNYWIQEGSEHSQKFREPVCPPESPSLKDWFYVPTWERKALASSTADFAGLRDARWLVFADRHGEGACIQAKLEKRQLKAGFVRYGDWFSRRAGGFYELNPTLLIDYLELFKDLQGENPQAVNIIHLGSFLRGGKQTRDPLLSGQNFSFYNLFYLAQAIGELHISVPIKIGIISNQVHQVTGEEALNPGMATVLGPCGVIPKEFPNVSCFNIDLPDGQAVKHWSDERLSAILSEFMEPLPGRTVAYRGKYRWRQKYQQVQLPETVATSTQAAPAKTLRQGGVYLITGGTGGIGLTIARYLAETCKAKVVLTKRSPFPEKSRWRELADTGDAPAPVLKVIDKLLQIEAAGAEVEVMVADVSDQAAMRKVLEKTVAKFGALHGVVHAAGILRAGLIQTTMREAAEEVLAPKVAGTVILADLLQELQGAEVEFLALFSSMASITTPLAHFDYSAANLFLDAFAAYSNTRNKFRTFSINWPVWKEVGKLADLEILPGMKGWKERILKKAIRTQDGLAAFASALDSNLTQVVVSPDNPNYLLSESNASGPGEYLLPKRTGLTPSSRAVHLNGADQPSGEVETAVASIWRSAFGIEHIGVHDNFFDIGGHSLLAARIVSQVERTLGNRLSVLSIFRAPTVSQLSAVLQGAPAPHAVSLLPRDTQQKSLLWLGGGAILRAVAGHLEDQRPMTVVTLPDEEVASLAPPYTMEEIASRMASTIQALQPRGPYFLGGWSLHGLLTYETARQLELRGCEVSLVVLVDPPTVPAWMPVWHRDLRGISALAERIQRRVTFYLSALWNMPQEKWVGYIQELAAAMKSRLQAQGEKNNGTERLEMAPKEYLTEIMLLAYLSYVPSSYSGRVLFLKPRQRPPDYWDPTSMWKDLAGSFEALEVPGDHVTMFFESNAELFAEHLRKAICEAQNQGGKLKPAADIALQRSASA